MINNETSWIYLDKAEIIRYIDSNIIGKKKQIPTPWGSVNSMNTLHYKKILIRFFLLVVYADYIETGRALSFIKHYIINSVLPL